MSARALLIRAPEGPVHSGAWALVFLRCLLACWLVGAAIAGGHFTGALGYSDVFCAAVIIGLSFATLRYPRMRFVMVPLALWIGFSSFILDGATLVSYMNEVIVGKTLIFAAIASHEMFDE